MVIPLLYLPAACYPASCVPAGVQVGVVRWGLSINVDRLPILYTVRHTTLRPAPN